jgi:hypothetical protein
MPDTRPSSANTGARSADDVAVHATIVREQERGRAELRDPRHREHARRRHERERDDERGRAPRQAREAVRVDASGPVAHGERGLVEHQHRDREPRVEPRGLEQSRQVEHVHRPADDEQALDRDDPGAIAGRHRGAAGERRRRGVVGGRVHGAGIIHGKEA